MHLVQVQSSIKLNELFCTDTFHVLYYNKGQNKSKTKLKPHDICFVLLSFYTFFYFAAPTKFIYENIYLESNIYHKSIKNLSHSSLGNKVVSIINLKSSTKYYGINMKSESENSKWHQMKVKAKTKKKIGTRSISKILDTMGCARSYLESSRCFSPLPTLHPSSAAFNMST